MTKRYFKFYYFGWKLMGMPEFVISSHITDRNNLRKLYKFVSGSLMGDDLFRIYASYVNGKVLVLTRSDEIERQVFSGYVKDFERKFTTPINTHGVGKPRGYRIILTYKVCHQAYKYNLVVTLFR